MGRSDLATLAILSAALGGSCSHHRRETYLVVAPPRDWSVHPAIEEVIPAGNLYAISDVHGGYDRMTALLTRYHLIDGPPANAQQAKWVGGNDALVVVGDMVDRGPKSVETMRFLQALQESARMAGGQVVVTFGNHEAEFLYDPDNTKADKAYGLSSELHALGIDPVTIASGSDPLGRWLRDLPLAVHAGSWFFAHAGQTAGRSIAQLEAAFRAAIDEHPDYDSAELVGTDSILEAKAWYEERTTNVQALGVDHIVIGHQPNALGPPGEIAMTADSALFRIDCGMSPDVNDSPGRMLRVRVAQGRELVESLDPDGGVKVLWSKP